MKDLISGGEPLPNQISARLSSHSHGVISQAPRSLKRVLTGGNFNVFDLVGLVRCSVWANRQRNPDGHHPGQLGRGDSRCAHRFDQRCDGSSKGC